MNDLFGAPTGGGATNLVSGSPEYQQAVVRGTEQGMKPAYLSALNRLRQNYASRGLMDSGLGAAAEMGMAQDYAGKLGQASNQAAIQGANLAEENRRRLEQRGWQVEDRDRQLQYLRDQADRAERAAGADRWANLIGGAAFATGGGLGSLLAGQLLNRGGGGGGVKQNTDPFAGLGVDSTYDPNEGYMNAYYANPKF